MTSLSVLISAGEPSGDMHAAAVVRALRLQRPVAAGSGAGVRAATLPSAAGGCCATGSVASLSPL